MSALLQTVKEIKVQMEVKILATASLKTFRKMLTVDHSGSRDTGIISYVGDMDRRFQ